MSVANKALIISMAAFLASATQARAETVTVLETEALQMNRAQASFDFDAESGRAWVNLRMDNGAFGDDYSEDGARALVPGLSYDAEARQIVYLSGDSRTICANVQSRKVLFLRSTRIKPTGGCQLKATFERQDKDSGFEWTQVRIAKVTMDVSDR